MEDYAEEIEQLREHLTLEGYELGDVVSHFVRGEAEKTLVVHFSRVEKLLPGDESLRYIDSPSTYVIMLNLSSRQITIPELL